ncbi:MAG: hypothetical protein WBQ50_20095 [Nocardioides sp.]
MEKHEGDAPSQEPGRPSRPDEATIAALGKLSEALEVVEEARGLLYAFHRRSGTADLTLGEAVEQLRGSGHADLAERVERELVGRNVLPGRWSFQVVEEYDDGYYRPFVELDRAARHQLADGRRHLYEAGMKEERRTHGAAGHEATPDDLTEDRSSPRPPAGAQSSSGVT